MKREAVAIIVQAEASVRWLFVMDKENYWELPSWEIEEEENKAFKLCHVAEILSQTINSDLDVISSLLIIDTPKVTVNVYLTSFEFEQNFQIDTDRITEFKWANPQDMIENDDTYQFTKDVLQYLVKVSMQINAERIRKEIKLGK